MKRKLSIILFVILSFVLGFLREFIFESINFVLDGKTVIEQNVFLEYVSGQSITTLNTLKFGLIPVFAGFNLLISLTVIQLFFESKKYNKLVIATFFGVFLLSLSLYIIGKAIGFGEEGYKVSRSIIEFIQSPLGCYFLIPALLLKEKKLSQ